jgi:oligopeptide/dipeptide ABC transporter ATP-binding protein
MSEEILRVERLKMYFPVLGGIFKRKVGEIMAVDDISFSVRSGETFALVGESGSGKTTTGRTIVRLLQPTSGHIWFGGEDISRIEEKDLKRIRVRMQMVFQDPTSSLNPRKTVKDTLTEPLKIHKLVPTVERPKKTLELLNIVQLGEDYLYRYPHELSGGEKQRLCIARALAVNPDFLVLDEPTSSLDVSVQAKVISLLRGLQKNMGLTFLYISHDIVLIKNIANDVGVMYFGKMVETGPTGELFGNPVHPYTKTLLSAVPLVEDGVRLPQTAEAVGVEAESVSLSRIPPGCRFYPRCSLRKDICKESLPELGEVSNNHWVACHLSR